ncbi:TolB family protein [Sabulibacter ruber]|uniref:TolB family protein n=1 Tax=Sabulibacter ruber TaxID=2811901 RepID=UPI001A95E66F|nr:PD40 domain-containing protein [Sabulibacter ruber]
MFSTAKKLFLALTAFPSLALAQSAPDTVTAVQLSATPRLFADGVISTQDFEFNATFTPDGKTVFFTKATPGWQRMVILYSEQKNGKWQEPKLAPFSGQYRDADPFISPDGQKLFFMSDRPVNGEPKVDYDIWFVSKTKDGWGEPQVVPNGPNTLKEVYYPSVAANGNMYFSALTASGMDLYVSKWENGQYAAPEKLSFNTAATDLDPIITADERLLFFTSNNRKAFGGADLFVSVNGPQGWSTPRPLDSNVNSSLNEGQPGLSADNKKLYFTSAKMPTGTRPKSASYKELLQELRGTYNGLGNIYEVDISALTETLTASK